MSQLFPKMGQVQPRVAHTCLRHRHIHLCPPKCLLRKSKLRFASYDLCGYGNHRMIIEVLAAYDTAEVFFDCP